MWSKNVTLKLGNFFSSRAFYEKTCDPSEIYFEGVIDDILFFLKSINN